MAKQAHIVDFQEARASSSKRTTSSRSSSRRRRSSSQAVSRTSSSARSRSTVSSAHTRRSAQRSSQLSAAVSRQGTTRVRSSLSMYSTSHSAFETSRAPVRAQRSARLSTTAARTESRTVSRTASRTAPRSKPKRQLPAFDLSFLSVPFQRIASISLFKRVLLGSLIFLVAAAAFLYPAARDYYTAVREQEKTAAAFDVALQRNQMLEQDVAALSTQTGVEDRMREQYGWVKQGENAVTVKGLEQEGSLPAHIADMPTVDSVTAPTTWYSPVLDRMFGYEG